jgi:phosphate ABC transporter phosphate-binding protein
VVPSNPYAPPTANTEITGSGSTFVLPLMTSWSVQYKKDHSNVKVTYGGVGSGAGKAAIQQQNVLFAGSDSPMSVSDKAKAPGVLQFPEALGVVGIVYNINGVASGLKLDGDTVGKIYAGTYTNWKDVGTAIGQTLPDQPIALVFRADSSGTTFVVTDFLAKTSSAFHDKIAAAATQTPSWGKSANAKQYSASGNDGVGRLVSQTSGAIGYVELAYVHALNLPVANMKNQAGEYLAPSSDGATKAISGFVGNLPAPDGDWSQVSIVNAPGAGSYPISSMTYVMVYPGSSYYGGKVNADQMAGFKAWMWWCLHDGQSLSTQLDYAPLPPQAVAIGETALAMIH